MYKEIEELSGIEFEEICKKLLERMGFNVETTKVVGDGGIDLIAYSTQPFVSGKYIIQCKRYSGSVGETIIRDLYGVVSAERANKGILLTTGVFTEPAMKFAQDKNIELIDGGKLHSYLSEYGLDVYIENVSEDTDLESIDKQVTALIKEIMYPDNDTISCFDKIDKCINLYETFLSLTDENLPLEHYFDKATWYLAALHFLKGDFAKAFLSLDRLLNSEMLVEYYEESYADDTDIGYVIFNLIQICNLIELPEIAEYYIKKYSDTLAEFTENIQAVFQMILADEDNEDDEEFIEFIKRDYSLLISGLKNLKAITLYILPFGDGRIYTPYFSNTQYCSPIDSSEMDYCKIEKNISNVKFDKYIILNHEDIDYDIIRKEIKEYMRNKN